MKKKIISLCLAATVAFTLASCKSDVNKSVPYGSLSDSVEYASVGNGLASISEKKLYDLMKKDGYSLMTKELKNQLFSDILNNKDYFDYSREDERYQINATLVSSIYGVSTYESFKDLKSKDKTISVQKYVDSLFENGTKKADGSYFTVNDILSITITESIYEGESVFEALFPEELYKDYIYDIAMENYAISVIKDENSEYYYKNEYVSGEGKNSYYITDEDIRDYYYTTYKYYNDYQGIVIKFASEAQANLIIDAALNGADISSDSEVALSQYARIYNQRYVTRDHISSDIEELNENEYFNIRVFNNNNQFTNRYSSQFETFFKEMNNGEYLTNYFNIDGYYYLVYRYSGDEIVEWEELDEVDKVAGDGSTIYDKILEELISSKNVSSLVSKLVSERYEDLIDDEAIEIYDPVYSYLFDQDYEDYEINSKSSDTLIYKFNYNEKEFCLSVDDFYQILENNYGIDTAIDYLSDQYYLSLDKMVEKIDSDTLEDYEDSINDEVKKFKKGKTSYSKKIGVTTYLQLTYGQNTISDVVEAYKADLVAAEAQSYYGNHEAVDGVSFNVDSTLFKNFETIYKDVYENYFSATISHILIGIDEDFSGSYTDPDIFRENLITDDLRQLFDETIINLCNAIIEEVKVLTISLDVKDALDYIVTAYDNNYKIASLSYKNGEEITWYDLKNQFPISLKAEDLGEIDNSSATSYVSEFSTAAKNLYNLVIDGTISETDVEDKGVFEFSEEISSIDVLCKTVYGYHMLNIYAIGEQDSAQFLKDNDSTDDDRDGYNIYEHLTIVVDPAEESDDDDEDEEEDYTLFADAYSDNDYASTSQLFIYFYESINGSSSSLKSSSKTAIASIFDNIISTYTSSTFVEWRLLNQMNIKFANDTDNFIMNYYISNLVNDLYGYELERTDFTLYTDWVDSSVYDWTIDFSK